MRWQYSTLEYRIGGLLNIRRFEAKTKVSLCVVTELQSADDLTLVAHSIGALQCLVNTFVRAYRAFGLQINVGKTEVLSQYTDKTPGPVYVGDEVIQQVDSFKYLGSLLTKSANIDFEVDNRISCAAKAFSRLRSRVFDSHELSLGTKCAVYRAVVIPTLLYACETWVPYRRHVQKLETFHLRQLRTILKIKWQDKVTNDEVLTRAKCSSITSLLPAHHLRWVGHLNRMGDERLPKKILYGQIKDAPRRPGGQKKRFKDVTREHLKKFCISLKDWESTSRDRTIWKAVTHRGAQKHANDLSVRKQLQRQQRQAQSSSTTSLVAHSSSPTSSSASPFSCDECGRTCGSRIGLFAHKKAHQRRR